MNFRTLMTLLEAGICALAEANGTSDGVKSSVNQFTTRWWRHNRRRV
jgi:hypothetical protein